VAEGLQKLGAAKVAVLGSGMKERGQALREIHPGKKREAAAFFFVF